MKNRVRPSHPFGNKIQFPGFTGDSASLQGRQKPGEQIGPGATLQRSWYCRETGFFSSETSKGPEYFLNI